MHALQMRPDRRFFVVDRPEIGMAGLRGERRMAPGRLDQRADAKAGARPQNDLRPGAGEKRAGPISRAH